jgi:hypothetical protein
MRRRARPRVRLPTSGPTFIFRKYQGSASPPDPASSLMTMALGPQTAPSGVGMSKPSRK